MRVSKIASQKRFVFGMALAVVAGAFLLQVTGIADYYLALVFPPSPIDSAYLKGKYSQGKPIRILLVPGHNTNIRGTYYNGLWERDLNIELSEKLYALLAPDPHFQVFITQNRDGFLPEFANYFTDRAGIRTFRESFRTVMKSLFGSGAVERKIAVHHNSVSSDVGNELYGINKWTHDNNVDIVLHIHFNDYPGRSSRAPGEYSGFTIYIPDRQFPNFEASSDIAHSLANELGRFFPKSDLPQESAGIVEDQDLIAVGANASLQSAGILVEYGYIYEPQFTDASVRRLAFSELSQETYNGLKRYFEGAGARVKDVASLPYLWTRPINEGAKKEPDIFALQMALSNEYRYPPAGRSKNDCPPSGNFGVCTRSALRVFQEANALTLSGILDFGTIAKLNQLFGGGLARPATAEGIAQGR